MTDGQLRPLAKDALAIGGVVSAAVFVLGDAGGPLELAAAAGIEGPALDGLVAAVRNPAHPVARALRDDAPTFDVLPTAPGGPALRSHFPLVADMDGERAAVGVLAVAHDAPMSAPDRARSSISRIEPRP